MTKPTTKKKSDKHVFLVLLLVIVNLSLLGCANRDCGGTFSVPQECKDYGYFLKGSYWVYQNDSTLQLDSFSVVFDSIFWIEFPDDHEGCNGLSGPPGGGEGYHYENYNSLATSNISEDSILYNCEGSGVDFFLNDRYLGVYLISSARQYDYPDRWELYDAAVINGKLYHYVYVSTHTSATIFFEKNIGVIKFQQPIDSTGYVESWSIVRYHTVQ